MTEKYEPQFVLDGDRILGCMTPPSLIREDYEADRFDSMKARFGDYIREMKALDGSPKNDAARCEIQVSVMLEVYAKPGFFPSWMMEAFTDSSVLQSWRRLIDLMILNAPELRIPDPKTLFVRTETKGADGWSFFEIPSDRWPMFCEMNVAVIRGIIECAFIPN